LLLSLPEFLRWAGSSTGADDYAPIKQVQVQKFDGSTWSVFGGVIKASGR
jgi:hypothetical protein